MFEWERLGISLEHLGTQIITTLIFMVIGLFFFGLADWFIEKFMNRSVRKAIEEDKNVALAIVLGAAIIGMAQVISAAIRG
jgi:putative membrane protein